MVIRMIIVSRSLPAVAAREPRARRPGTRCRDSDPRRSDAHPVASNDPLCSRPVRAHSSSSSKCENCSSIDVGIGCGRLISFHIGQLHIHPRTARGRKTKWKCSGIRRESKKS